MDKLILVELINEHKSQREMASLLKCSHSTIKHWLKQYKLKTLYQIKLFECKQCGETDSSQAMKKGSNQIAKSLCKIAIVLIPLSDSDRTNCMLLPIRVVCALIVGIINAQAH